MIPPVIVPVVRRAIVDFLADDGGEYNDDVLTIQLVALGHRVARCDIAEEQRWLATQQLCTAEELGPYVVSRILPKGKSVAASHLKVDGVSRHRTGE